MIQATEDIGTQWILDLCNSIVKANQLHSQALEVKYGITNLRRERGSNGVWILQEN